VATLDNIGIAALQRDSLRLRSLVQDFVAGNPDLSAVPRPSSEDPRVLSAAASIVELLALRAGQQPPDWTGEVGPLEKPFYLLAAAETMPRLRRMCEQDAPEPLQKRRLFAPANFLTWV
jgi:hypothetical protein